MYSHYLSFPCIVNRRSPQFDLRTSLIPQKGRYVVLMFVGETRGTPGIEYQIIDRAQISSPTAILTARGKYIFCI